MKHRFLASTGTLGVGQKEPDRNREFGQPSYRSRLHGSV
jgi:hypothetical protein